MAVSETEWEQNVQDAVHGKLIALEGDEQMLATQLRLLPPSEKFLVIPSMSENFSDKDDFSPRSYVRAVHLAFEERTERARTFLRTGTNSHPRLVFMNGGSVSARSRCISRICEHTGGDVEAAENVFNQIVQHGVGGLMKDISEDNVRTEKDITHAEVEREVEIPRQKFMKAAEFLKRGTAGQQLQDTEFLIASPTIAATRSAEDIFKTERGDEILRAVLEGPPHDIMQRRGTFGSQYDNTEYDPYADIASPGDGSFFSGSPPTSPIVYGEACLVDMGPKPPRRAQSMDRFYPSNSRFMEPPASHGPLKHTTSASHLRTRRRTAESLFQLSHDGFTKLPRKTFVKASETTIRKSPTLAGSLNLSSTSFQMPGLRLFVDRGTDAKEAMEGDGKMANTWESEPFTPVFPVVEDFILQLFDGQPDAILESVIRTSKDGSYPAIPLSGRSPDVPLQNEDSKSAPSSPFSEGYDSPTSPMSALSQHYRSVLRLPSYLVAEETGSSDYDKPDEYDPYASHDEYPPDIKRRWPQSRHLRIGNDMEPDTPPTPALTPSPTHGNAEKFFDFSPVNTGNAINVQNSLRQLLSMHFPASDYSQYYYPVAPEAERLWKPVFRNDESSSIGNEGRTVDHIIALGCEDGVKRDFFYQVSGQIERLGSKRDGTNRSGKLDIGYLIAQVIQRSTSRSYPLTINQLLDPTVLAPLLVPGIESFLATNISTRFLILHYPLNHLATVFELHKLLGSELFKVAGILDSLASDPPSMSRPRTPNNPLLSSPTKSRLNPLTTLRLQTSFTRAYPKPEPGPSSFSKANFVLPSTATDAEITAFLSGIRKVLMEKSPFYTPERPELEPKAAMPERPSPPPPVPSALSVSTRDALDRDSGYPASIYRGATSKISRLTGTSGSGSQTNYEPSVNSKYKYASSIASTKTTRTERGRKNARGDERGAENEWDSFYIGDDDSEDDEFDKMILGRAMEVKAAVAPKRDKKKALKWLGLA